MIKSDSADLRGDVKLFSELLTTFQEEFMDLKNCSKLFL